MLIVFFPDTFEKSAVYGLIIVIHLNYIHSALKKKKIYMVNIWCSSLVKTGTKCSEDVSRAKILSTQRRKKKKKELLLLATLLSWHRDRSKAASLQGQGQ